MKSLFLCTTPLQVKIGQAIVKRNELDARFVYVLSQELIDDAEPSYLWKQKPYVEQCDQVVCFSLETLDYEAERLLGFYDGIYLASFDNLLLMAVAKLHPATSIYGFDDGGASVSEKGIYMALGAEYLKNRVVKHYTIYQTDFHVIDKAKLEYIPIEEVFEFPETICRNGRELVVFLGEEILADPVKGLSFNQVYVDELQPDWYIPHPRARFNIEYDRVLNAPKLFEELLSEWMLEYEKIIVYHFSSSVGLHLKHIPQVEFHGIRIKPLDVRQLEMMREGMMFENIPLNNWF